MLVSLDIETARHSLITDPKDYDALVPHKAYITVIGVYTETGIKEVFRGPGLLTELQKFLKSVPNAELIGHEFKFDIKHLVYAYSRKNTDVSTYFLDKWQHDTKLLSYVIPDKVPDWYLAEYESKRKELNKALPKGYSHRPASLHSLKTLAPFILNVEPFWEDPSDHNNDEYVLKDVEYTFRLFEALRARAHSNDFKFYLEKQLPWTKELLRAELKGIKLDQKLLVKKQVEAEQNKGIAETQLKTQWSEYFSKYRALRTTELYEKYMEMATVAQNKCKDSNKLPGILERYRLLYKNALEKADFNLNLNSPEQLKWLLKDQLELSIENFDGADSTEAEVLEKLAVNNDQVKTLLEYRKYSKLCSTYYPSYNELSRDGRIHCNFNTSDTRTGRTSSSLPNLQNQPPEVREIFVADTSYKLVVRDLSGIEPTLAAYFSEDPELCNILINGMDFHGETARVIFSYITCPNKDIKKKYARERAVAKTGGLAILYGSGAKRLKKILEEQGFTEFSIADCKRAVQRIRKKYAGVWSFKQRLDYTLEQGETVINLLGRPIKFASKDEIYMKGFNRLIQGSASDLLLEALRKTNEYARYNNIDSVVLLAVHDELVLQVPDKYVKVMETVLEKNMTEFELETKYGQIPLKVEGATDNYWRK